MSRASRRQADASPKERGAQRSLNLRQQRDTRGAKPPPTRRRRLRIGLPRWLEDIFSELKKVTWPTREETAYLTMVVIIVSSIAGVILGGIDILFNWLIDRILLQ
jgi:preprotein translocase subunit SecE